MIEIDGNFIIGYEKKNQLYKQNPVDMRIFDSIRWEIDDCIKLTNNVIYSINGKHRFLVKVKLWVVRLLFRQDFKHIQHQINQREGERKRR